MKKNEILQEILMALHAKDKLDEITEYLKSAKNNEVSKEELLKIIEKDEKENDYF